MHHAFTVAFLKVFLALVGIFFALGLVTGYLPALYKRVAKPDTIPPTLTAGGMRELIDTGNQRGAKRISMA